MIFLHRDLIDQDFGVFLTLVLSTCAALIIGIAFHEFCHAFVADRLGDGLPRAQGRVTLNPLAHLDPAGTVLMLFAGFGWGKPVQHNPYASKFSPKVTTLLVAIVVIGLGVSQIGLALKIRPQPGWAWLVGAGLASLLLGIALIARFPFSLTVNPGVMAGISLVGGGVAHAMIGISQRVARGPPRTRTRS